MSPRDWWATLMQRLRGDREAALEAELERAYDRIEAMQDRLDEEWNEGFENGRQWAIEWLREAGCTVTADELADDIDEERG